MKTSPKMQQIVEAIAQKHGLDLTKAGAHLRLEMTCFQPLVIEALGFGRISVTHYSRQNGDAIADPDVEFKVTPEGWQPIAMQSWYGGYSRPESDTYEHRALVAFCELWAGNISAQGWLTRGRRSGDDDSAAVAVPVAA
jgi:hypothetical protein